MIQTLSGKTLLLVDDRPENLLTLEAILEPSGAQLITALSGNEALKLLHRGTSVDCILMDVQMPDMNGFEAAALLQLRPKTAVIPVIFITADDAQREVDAPHKQQLPEPRFLHKPIDQTKLLQLLETVLKAQ